MRITLSVLILILLLGCSQSSPIIPLQISSIEPLPPLTDWPNVHCIDDNCPPPSVKEDCVDLQRLLAVIKHMESSDGVNCQPRFEPAFLSKYGDNGVMPELRKLFGDEAAASSYSCYQVMLCVAWENDFKYTPEQLENNGEIVAEYLLSKYATIYSALPIRDRIHAICKKYNGSNQYAKKATNLYFQK